MELPPLNPFTLNGYRFDPSRYLHKEYDDIGEASVELPAVIEWLNEQLQWVVESKIAAKATVKRVEAQEFNRLRGGEYTAEFSGKMTDAALNAAVMASKKVKKANDDYATFCGWHTRLFNLISVLDAKLNLVRSVEATRRRLIGNEED